MKTFKLIAGIFCCILFVFIVFQSCAAGLVNSLEDNGEVGGSAGLFVAVFLLAGGIAMISTRNHTGRGGSVACAIIFVLGGLLGVSCAGSYADLKIWGGLSLILGFINIIAAIKSKSQAKE